MFDDGSHPAYHEITIYNALQVGERVILIRVQGGQKFVVVDRVGVWTQ